MHWVNKTDRVPSIMSVRSSVTSYLPGPETTLVTSQLFSYLISVALVMPTISSLKFGALASMKPLVPALPLLLGSHLLNCSDKFLFFSINSLNDGVPQSSIMEHPQTQLSPLPFISFPPYSLVLTNGSI